MPAVLNLTQAGLPAGTDGVSREDLTSDGALITVTNVNPGGSNELELTDMPISQAAVPTLTPAGDTWTFSFTPGVWGAFKLKLTVDGESTEREYVIPSPLLGISVPSHASRSDPTATLADGSTKTESSTNNTPEPGTVLSGGSWVGWKRAWYKLATVLESILPNKLNGAMTIDTTISASRDLAAADFPQGEHKLFIVDTDGGAVTLTAVTGLPVGRSATFQRRGSNDMIFAEGASMTIYSENDYFTAGNDKAIVTISYTASDEAILGGGLTS